MDVLLTHAPSAEEELVKDGFAEERIPVFHNDFVVVRDPSDGPLRENPPASLDDVLQQIASRNLPFVSRGDDSGTHRKEQQLWKSVSIEPKFSGYITAGSGMAQTLRIAEEKRACTHRSRNLSGTPFRKWISPSSLKAIRV
ncbi:MAG: substrate-binding domain-containing protein [Planctomycetaceae bacterium]